MRKTIFITGSVKGLGKEIAKHFAGKNYNVVIHYNKSKDLAEKFYSELKKINDNILLVHGDVTNQENVRDIFNIITSKFGKLDILINHVVNFVYKNLNDTDFNDFKNVIESNLYSVFLCSKEVLRIMNKNGSIINIGCASCERVLITKHTTPYYIAKNGVYTLTKLMAKELPIRVNMVSPGILGNSVIDIGSKKETCNYEDVINAIEFLLSDKALNINGTNIEVSKGWCPGLN